jgi:hypothetical protein
MEEACARLGVGETRVRELRDEVLSAALSGLEPKTVGRPKNELSEEEKRIKELEERIRRLEFELKGAHLRAKIALVMPHLLKDPESIKKKG